MTELKRPVLTLKRKTE
ncbi:TPA: hypothetical protein ACV7T1_005363, partial [Escherichia coli]